MWVKEPGKDTKINAITLTFTFKNSNLRISLPITCQLTNIPTYQFTSFKELFHI
jgi:hypothetical protein